MHLKQPGYTYSVCGSFTKNKERIKKFKEIENTNYVYKNELDKTCFQHDMVYGEFKDLSRKIASDKCLSDKAFNLAKNAKYDGYQRGLAFMVYKFFDKKSASGSGVATLANKSTANNEIKQNLQLTEELHKPFIRNLKKRTVYSRFKDNILGSDLADMQLRRKLNIGFRFELSVIDIFGKHAWVVPLKDKKGISIVNAFRKILNYSARKPNKIWVDNGSEFYNNFF